MTSALAVRKREFMLTTTWLASQIHSTTLGAFPSGHSVDKVLKGAAGIDGLVVIPITATEVVHGLLAMDG